MIGIVEDMAAPGTADPELVALVAAAFARSVSDRQVTIARLSHLENFDILAVPLHGVAQRGDDLLDWWRGGRRKLVVFGALPAALQSAFGHESVQDLTDNPRGRAVPARSFASSESEYAVSYGEGARKLQLSPRRRAFERFDFTNEWNNHGYGRIRLDGSIWALAEGCRVAREHLLADMVDGAGEVVSAYAGLIDDGERSVLWFNRPVGCLDSFEWRLVENFISGHGYPLQPCQPVLSEIPAGHDCAVTMRLDCDEDVASAKALWEAYRNWGVPLSLAIHTTVVNAHEHDSFIVDVAAAGGTIMGHSATHAPHWGGSFEAALAEATASRADIAGITGSPPEYAVSPFHQTTDYAIRALAEAGYGGCIGGVINADPRFIAARGGMTASHPDVVFHTQQCMLHGDCLLEVGDPLANYKLAFDLAHESRSLFGYLDHPFSERYQYGWTSEAARREAHAALISYIRSRAQRPLFMSEAAALEFLRARASVEIASAGGGRFEVRNGDLRVVCELGGRSMTLAELEEAAL